MVVSLVFGAQKPLYGFGQFFFIVVWLLALVHVVAFLILLERKLLAASQRRVGPAVLGRRGFFQILADVIKPLFKEVFEVNFQALTLITLMIFVLIFSQLTYAIFFQYGLGASVYEDVEFILFIQSFFGGMSTVATFLIGFLSKTKYGMMGAIRLVLAETGSDVATYIANSLLSFTLSGLEYESLFLGQIDFCMLGVFGFVWGVVGLFNMFITAQRAPLDLIENEGELVAGYNTEYSGPDVLVIYFAEYFHLFNAGLQFIFISLGGYLFFGADLFTVEVVIDFIGEWLWWTRAWLDDWIDGYWEEDYYVFKGMRKITYL